MPVHSATLAYPAIAKRDWYFSLASTEQVSVSPLRHEELKKLTKTAMGLIYPFADPSHAQGIALVRGGHE
jgi:hypothetical protein